MKIRKDMIFAVLTTFCLSALMFAVIPIRSIQPYDPWADYDANDKIDMKDIGKVASLFGALNTDNLTRNVNVTNWPTQQLVPSWKVATYTDLNISWTDGSSAGTFIDVPCGGYSTFYVYVSVGGVSWTNPPPDNVTLFISLLLWHSTSMYASEPFSGLTGWEDCPPSPLRYTVYRIGFQMNPADWTKPPQAITVKAPYVSVNFHTVNPTQLSGWITINVDIYFRSN